MKKLTDGQVSIILQGVDGNNGLISKIKNIEKTLAQYKRDRLIIMTTIIVIGLTSNGGELLKWLKLLFVI